MMASFQSPQPAYAQVKDRVTADIRSGHPAPGDRAPSITELMARYRIGRSTARRVVSDLLDEGLVHKRPGLGTFVTSFEVLGRRRVSILLRGADISGFFRADSYQKEYLGGFVREMHRLGIQVEVTLTQTENTTAFRGAVGGGRHHGFLVLPLPSEDQRAFLRQTSLSGTPVLFAFDRCGPLWVDGDFEGAAREAVGRLLSTGRRDLLYIDLSLAYASAQSRRRGVVGAFHEAGMPLLNRRMIHIEDYWANIQNAVTDILEKTWSSGDIPSALFLGGAGPITRAARSFFARRRIAVPQELAVISAEDEAENAFGNPTISALSVPFEAMGIASAQTLFAQMNENPVPSPPPFPCPFISRESTPF